MKTTIFTTAVIACTFSVTNLAHAVHVASPTGTTEWRFNDVTGSGSGAVINPNYGPGTMSQVGALTGNTFGTTGNTYNGDAIPNINGQSSGIVYTIGANSVSSVGYRAVSNVDGPDAGHRKFTMIYDMFIPTAGVSAFTSLYQGNAGNTNDVDGYLINSNQSTVWNATASQYATGTWERIALTVDYDGSSASFYRNGVIQGSGAPVDYVFDAGGPFWILSDDNGNHTDSAWANFAFVPDQVLDADTIAQLGGADARGIFNVPNLPEPSTFMLVIVGVLSLVTRRRRR